MGINVGDIIIEDGDIFGDGVNIAARLEALAEPGGICLSAAAHEQVRDRLDIAFVDLGEQQVKNITRPVRTYGVALGAQHPQSERTLASPRTCPWAYLTDAMVIDVGGTTTDIGQLRRGFPREANSVVEVGGVRTLFRMPDLLSIGLGGGSLVSADGISVGPKSVGYRLIEEGLVFGGHTVTATDVAVAAGLARIGDDRAVADLPRNLVQRALDIVRTKIGDSVDRMKTDARELPLIAVGGGAFLVPDRLAGISQVSHVPHGDCANAVGAAIAQVSGETDQVYRDLSRDEAIAAAEAQARERAIVAGAERGTLQTVDVEDIPLAYLPGNALRVRVRVAGEMASSTNKNGSSSVSQ
jgi:N-methylhydantoinase A/oxoprolinase/acetone carboxylase beta subunit